MMSAMMESTVMMRTPHRRWRSMTKTRPAPNPVVSIVVIPRIGRAIHVVVIPIRITGNRCPNRNCCHNRSCNHWCWRNHCGSGSHNYRWAQKTTNEAASKATPESAMMGERHQAKAHRQCHNSQFLVHCLVLRLEVCCLSISIYIIQHTLRYVKRAERPLVSVQIAKLSIRPWES